MTTIQILTKNNEKTIAKTLESIEKIQCEKTIIDLNSSDKTCEICSKYKDVKIFNHAENESRAAIRNKFSKEKEINIYLNPWENLIQGDCFLNKIIENKEDFNLPVSVYVLENQTISKEIRIWKDQKFTNPVYESINSDSELEPRIIIYSDFSQVKDERKNNLEKVNKWLKEKPLSIEPYYYAACCHLSLRNYEKFFYYSNQYFSKEMKIEDSYLMLKYYNAQVKLYLNKVKEAAESVMFCLSYKPFMAEFWCLLGDIYYKQKKLNKSICFYENAIIIGEKRKNQDFLPIEINKYQKYPKEMIETIRKIKKESYYV